MSDQPPTDPPPWYRQFWPWFLIGLPAIVVVACGVSIWLALSNPFDLVEDNYYKEGLAINQDLARVRKAEELGISASLFFSGADANALITPENLGAEVLQLRLHHPLDASQDFEIVLLQEQPGFYRAQGDMPHLDQRWYLELLGDSNDYAWTLSGEVAAISPSQEVRLQP